MEPNFQLMLNPIGLVIESTELAVDLGAILSGTLVGDGSTGATTLTMGRVQVEAPVLSLLCIVADGK